MLEIITVILFAAFSTASFSKLFDYTLEVDNILHGWYVFLLRKGRAVIDPETSDLKEIAWWTKPLGICIVCFNFWGGIIPYSLIAYSMEFGLVQGVVFFFSFQGLSFIILTELNKRYV